MADHPIIFSGPMVQALLRGDKTMTRRLAWGEKFIHNPLPMHGRKAGWKDSGTDGFNDYFQKPSLWQRVKPNDRLWVRERVCSHRGFGFPLGMCPQHNGLQGQVWSYFADGIPNPTNSKPSIHMPRWASRITLIVSTIKIEPLQTISEQDAADEGIIEIHRSLSRHGRLNGYGLLGTLPEEASTTRINAFHALWRSLHGPESWDANPEVVALSFRVIASNIDSKKTKVA